MPNPEHIAALKDTIDTAQTEYDNFVTLFPGEELYNALTASNIASHIEDMLTSFERVKGTSKEDRITPNTATSRLINDVAIGIMRGSILIISDTNEHMLRAYWHLIAVHKLEALNSKETFAQLMQAILSYED